tara:strand:+ start:601 stop:888 length:288 start_codon:yes stop_codon:yes gene_type:complete
MDYAIQVLIPIALGLYIGIWMHQNWGASPIWTVVLAILGLFAGIGILYKKSLVYAERHKRKMAQEQPLVKSEEPSEDPLAALRNQINHEVNQDEG